jgi:hypothetical protein
LGWSIKIKKRRVKYFLHPLATEIAPQPSSSPIGFRRASSSRFQQFLRGVETQFLGIWNVALLKRKVRSYVTIMDLWFFLDASTTNEHPRNGSLG